ncbi:hypothetical protein N9J50_00005 [Methylophilaceae bacterium]|jgi:hypothetical protein|nr:hypothetical protein [Methylophilaceae bacterium]
MSCATLDSKEQQYPAPHNDYTGVVVQEHFSSEEPNNFMIRTCRMYGGLNQDSVENLGKDRLLQYIMQFKCNYAGKFQDEVRIDGKSSVRLNGASAKNKCENLGFEVGTVRFRKCMEELTR